MLVENTQQLYYAFYYDLCESRQHSYTVMLSRSAVLNSTTYVQCASVNKSKTTFPIRNAIQSNENWP